MATLPASVHERLISEFRFAADKVSDSPDQVSKLYFFSVFYGETGRQLNIHWDADLALMFVVVQGFCQQIPQRPGVPGLGVAPGTLPADLLSQLDGISEEFVAAFEKPEVDVMRLYAALARTAEINYATTGNGSYLRLKGMINL